MIIKFHNRGGGSGSGPVDYLLGKDLHREDATLLRGEPDRIVDLIDTSPFKKKYTSGVLSFSEENIPEENKDELMDSFEEALLPGLDKDQYSFLWVEHRDKERLELNFVIPNIELRTGKRLQPYYHSVDLKRMNAWKDVQNYEYGFTDPNDPERKQNLTLPNRITHGKKELIEGLNEYLEKMIEQGMVQERSDVIKILGELGSEMGFEITRTTPSSISINDPDGNRNIRLKGAIYEQGFRAEETYPGETEARTRKYREQHDRNAEKSRDTLESCIEKKREYNLKRYPRLSEENQISVVQTMDTVALLRNAGVDQSIGDSKNPGNEIDEDSRGYNSASVSSGYDEERELEPFSNRDEGREVYHSSQRNGSRSELDSNSGEQGIQRGADKGKVEYDRTGKDITEDIRYKEIKEDYQVLKKEVGFLQDSLVDLSSQLKSLGRQL
jgi:hypothetical protein